MPPPRPEAVEAAQDEADVNEVLAEAIRIGVIDTGVEDGKTWYFLTEKGMKWALVFEGLWEFKK